MVNNVYDENFFIFCRWVPYHITYSISTKNVMLPGKLGNISISIKLSLISLESLAPHSKKMEGIYKAD